MLSVQDLSVSFDGRIALSDIDMEVAAGERLAVLGPSGSGKSTLLRAIAGVQRAGSGQVLLEGKDLSGVPPHKRGVGLMFQEGALFPHRDVKGNVSFGLEMARVPAAERARRTEDVLALVGLAGFRDRAVASLSGGERQRVALARALAPEPRVLLLDEPLGSLDGPLRSRLTSELIELFNRLELTVIHVTHDAAEAFTMGHRVALMRESRIVQSATPDELWARPANEWVARFLGRENIQRDGQRTTLVPAEAIRVKPGDEALVIAAQRQGHHVRLLIRKDDGQELAVVTTEPDHAQVGDRVRLDVDQSSIVPLGPSPQP